MRKGILVGLGAVLALAATGATEASACSRRVATCGGYGYAPPVAYQFAPPAPIYGYGYGPPPAAYYAPPVYGRADYYGPVAAPYGYRARRGCNRGYGYGNGYYGYGNGYYGNGNGYYGYNSGYYGNGNGYYGNGNGYYGNGYGYAPPVAYDGYRPAGVWVPVR
jgi:hypothetical protein